MKQTYTLSKSNKIYFGVIAVIISVLFFITIPNKSSYQIGAYFGKLISYLLFPTLFAWIVWLIRGRKEKGGSITFNIVLTLLLLGQIGQYSNKIQQSQKIQELADHKEEFKEKISSTDDPELFDNAYKTYTDSVKEGLDELSETSTGQEKQFYKIMSGFVSEAQKIAQDWNAAYNSVLSPRILDYSILNSDEEFDYQKNVLTIYIEKTKVYNEYFDNMVPNLKMRLKELGDDNKYADGAVNGAIEKYLLQKKYFEPLIKEHAEYGKNMILILELLQNNKNEWSFENGEFSIYSEYVLSEFNNLIKGLGDNEKTINTLSEKMIEEI